MIRLMAMTNTGVVYIVPIVALVDVECVYEHPY